MTPEDQARADQIRARADAATAGPWEVQPATEANEFYVADNATADVVACGSGFITQGGPVEDGGPAVGALYPVDAEFIAAARSDVPWLLDRLAEATAEVERLRADLQRVASIWTGSNPDRTKCAMCFSPYVECPIHGGA